MRVYFRTFGCRVNQYETQALREKLLADGLSAATENFEEADLCVVNTCTVTREADRDALLLIRRIARRNPASRLVVTGCLASRDPELILREAPSALVVGNEGKANLPAMLGCQSAPGWSPIQDFEGRSRAFVKVQDGCNMGCAFCIIPSIRPKLSCKPYEDLEAEVENLIRAGYGELVLCGIRLGRYLVEDKNGKRVDFVSMLGRLLNLPGDFRIRLSSLEITDLTHRLINLMGGCAGKLCPSLHLPLQSGSEEVLKTMRRWYSAAFYARRVSALRTRLPRAGIFADVMVGFPGETQEQFEESREFIRRLGFSGLHVFRYSKRDGTEAASRPCQVPEEIILKRAEELRAMDRGLRAEFARKAVGSLRRILMGKNPLKPEGLAEDFLSVKLESHPGPGFHRVRVTRAEGPAAYAAPA